MIENELGDSIEINQLLIKRNEGDGIIPSLEENEILGQTEVIVRDSWKFWGNMLTLMLVAFVGDAARGLVVPSLFLYLQKVR